jgi:4-hydroxybutyrate dehydrogenase
MIAEMSYPTQIIFGKGAIRALSTQLARMGVTRPLVLTDRALASNGLLARLTAPLDDERVPYVLLDSVDLDPTLETVERALAVYREGECDGLVSLGGGSPMDTGKAVRLLSAHPPPLARYDWARGGGRFITRPMPPMVAIPTTAGTGSEANRNLVISLPETGRKTVISAQAMIPSLALCDPELTYGMPPWLTAGTGMDALVHNMEALWAKGFHPLADAMARKGIELCGKYLVRAVKDGHDEEARAGMMVAALAGAAAMQKALGPVHSLAHPLTPVCGLHHGLATAVILPVVMEFNLGAAAPQLAEVAAALGEPPSRDLHEAARRGVDRVRAMRREMPIPARLRDAGVKESQFALLTEKAFQDSCHLANPRPCEPADLEAMFRAAW